MANAALTWKALESWHTWRGYDVHDWRNPRLRRTPRHVDSRLFTVAPAFVGLFDAVIGYGAGAPSAAMMRLLIGMIQRAVGTYDSSARPRQTDWRRTHVVCDWMVRCALPISFDGLSHGAGAQVLRQLHPLQWPTAVVDAIATLTPMWVRFGAETAEGTAEHRQAAYWAGEQAGQVIGVLTQLLSASFRYRPPDGDWLCHMAGRALISRTQSDGGDDYHPEIVATVPRLIEILLTVREGDSQRNVADRCVWSSNARQSKRVA
jgi:hypothetical protein